MLPICCVCPGNYGWGEAACSCYRLHQDVSSGHVCFFHNSNFLVSHMFAKLEDVHTQGFSCCGLVCVVCQSSSATAVAWNSKQWCRGLFVPGCCRKSINKGIGVDNMHYLNDGLWKVCSPFSLCTLWACVLVLKDSHGFMKLAWDSKHLTWGKSAI